MTEGGQQPSNLDLYLDGLLTGEPLRDFEEELSRNPQLRATVEAQRQIDASLHRLIVAPPAPSVIPQTYSLKPSPLARLRPWIAIAAVLLIGLSIWRIWDTYYAHPTPIAEYPGSSPRTMDTIYQVEKNRGFKPMWKCETDKEFATTFWKNLGAALTFRNPPPNVASLGLSYGNVIDLSPKCVYMLFKIDGREVIVFIDKKSNDHNPKLTTPGLHLFRRETGQFVLYEMTPLDRPMVFDKFEPFTMPDDWK